jgi:hypothetical protein
VRAVSKHVIRLRGCDDSTDIEIDLTPTEMRVVERLVAKTDVIGGGCKPTIIIDPEPLTSIR